MFQNHAAATEIGPEAVHPKSILLNKKNKKMYDSIYYNAIYSYRQFEFFTKFLTDSYDLTSSEKGAKPDCQTVHTTASHTDFFGRLS